MNEPLFTDPADESEVNSEINESADTGEQNDNGEPHDESGTNNAHKKRRRGSRGGRNRPRPQGASTDSDGEGDEDFDDDDDIDDDGDFDDDSDFDDEASYDDAPHVSAPIVGVQDDFELPERMNEGRADVDAATEDFDLGQGKNTRLRRFQAHESTDYRGGFTWRSRLDGRYRFVRGRRWDGCGQQWR